MNNVILYPSIILLSGGLSLFAPLLTGIGTRFDSHPAVKAVFNAVLTVVIGIVSTAIESPDTGIPLYQSAYAVLFAFVMSAASYHSLWKPTTIAARVQKSTSEIGIG